MTTDPTPFETIADLIETRAMRDPERVAIESVDDVAISYRELCERVRRLAHSLGAICSKGRRGRPRFAIVMQNGGELAVTLLAATCRGTALPFNPAYTAGEFDSYFVETWVDALIVAPGGGNVAREVARNRGLPVIEVAQGGHIGIDGPMQGDLRSIASTDDVALVLMTSGSTGRPKSVPLSHENVCVSASDVARSIELGPDDRCLCMWEQYHVGGLVDLLLAPLAAGGTVIVTSGFNADLLLRLVREKQPTWLQVVPTALGEILLRAERTGNSLKGSSLRLVRSVAAALSPRMLADAEEAFGTPVIQTFGMTEAGPLITSTRLPPAVRKPGSAGSSCGTEIRIAGPQDAALHVGERGEVMIRGRNVFKGYENSREANLERFRGDWFSTGDIGYLDADGDLFLVGRLSQQINRGGEKINPQEVDDALLAHEAIAEAATFGVPHRTLGEDVAAAIVLRNGASFNQDDLRDFLRGRLAAFKVPARITPLPALPRNSVGKTDRLALSHDVQRLMATNRRVVAPRNALEHWIAELWSRELSLQSVGVRDDFAALGGDSLTSLRIVSEIETTFALHIPDKELPRLTTIDRLAVFLRDHGIEDKNVQNINADNVPATTVGDVSISDFELARIELSSVRDRRTLGALTEALTLHNTPAEIVRIIAEISDVQPGSVKLPWISRRLLSRKFKNWKSEIIGNLPEASHRWSRQPIGKDIILYSDGSGPEIGKTLIVSFAGNRMRLMLPTYKILSHIEPANFDLLLLLDPRRQCFLRGIDGYGRNLAELGDWIDGYRRQRGYCRAIALGTSGGGLPALIIALAQSWFSAVMIGAAGSEQLPELLAQLKQIVKLRRLVETSCHAYYGARNEVDAQTADQISQILTTLKKHPVLDFNGHNLLHLLDKNDNLGRFFNTILQSDREGNNRRDDQIAFHR